MAPLEEYNSSLYYNYYKFIKLKFPKQEEKNYSRVKLLNIYSFLDGY